VSEANNRNERTAIASQAMRFIVLMAFVSLFNDMTFEGASSVLGAYETLLGMPTIWLTALSGAGALLGCSLRMLFGYLSDKTGKYWPFVLLGYALDMISVPLLALVPENGWALAIVFILSEKLGKAIKKPAKSALVSFAAKQKGEGRSFALGEALDQIGACIGPLIVTLVFACTKGDEALRQYHLGFLFLSIPALACLGLLITARIIYPKPEDFERGEAKEKVGRFEMSPSFVAFCVGGAIFAMGFLDSFSLLNKDILLKGLVDEGHLPLLYSYAMFIDALSALAFGFLFDKIGFLSLAIATLLSAPYGFLIFFSSSLPLVFIGLTSWGIGIGAVESVLLSGVARLSSKENRARSYGFFELCYGLSAFGFSFLIAHLYESSPFWLSLFIALSIVAATLLFLLAEALHKTETPKPIKG
jgi:MFS family permease